MYNYCNILIVTIIILISIVNCCDWTGSRPNPKDRHTYYECTGGKQQLLYCPRNGQSIYSSIMVFTGGKCVEPFVCPQLMGLYPNPYNQSEYYQCRNAVPDLQWCPVGQVFIDAVAAAANGIDAATGNCSDTFQCPVAYGNVAYDNNDDYYYECMNRKHNLKRCDSGFHFDKQYKLCRQRRHYHHRHHHHHHNHHHQQQQQHNYQTNFECPTAFGTYRDPNNTNKYYECINYRSVHHICPGSQEFDGQFCLNKTIGARTSDVGGDGGGGGVDGTLVGTNVNLLMSANFICPQQNGLFADPGNRSQYYDCFFGRPKLKQCPIGLVYNELDKICTGSSTANSNVEDVDGRKQQLQQGTVSFICPERNGRYIDPETIENYYSCYNWIARLMSCPNGFVFDGHDCRNKFHCTDPNGKYRSPHKHNEYYECSNGIPTLRACADGYEFDNGFGYCVNRDKADGHLIHIISGRIIFEHKGMKVIDTWDRETRQWKRTYDEDNSVDISN
ncbi:uncharacterized protein LOC128956723 [Oppia nitens]|uniref:uncharacterized protein LOC128956723 n=1 Tax=Oppia nitens TaxID=1686743 RepID=UPI0023DAB4B3|nr:uncharacterized protein LOC128956723 [Oppia nitens]